MDSPDLPKDASPRTHDFARLLARLIYRTAYRVRARGLGRVPRSGPLVLVANHSSMIEPQILFGILPRRSVFLVKHQVFHGVLGWALRTIGQVPVHRGRAARSTLSDAVRVLRGGGVVAVFPEGTRGEGNVTKAEPGAAWLVRATAAQVLPVAVRGTKPPSTGRKRLRPVVDIHIGEPFALTVEPGREGLAAGTEELRKELVDTVSDLDEYLEDRGKGEVDGQ